MTRAPIQRQQEVQTEQTAVAFVPVTRAQRVGQSGGILMVDGVTQIPVRIWEPASSNGMTKYATVEWVHPTTQERRLSCNCPGWANMRGSERTCKHVVQMAADTSLGRSPDAVADDTRAVPIARHIVQATAELRRGISLEDE